MASLFEPTEAASTPNASVRADSKATSWKRSGSAELGAARSSQADHTEFGIGERHCGNKFGSKTNATGDVSARRRIRCRIVADRRRRHFSRTIVTASTMVVLRETTRIAAHHASATLLNGMIQLSNGILLFLFSRFFDRLGETIELFFADLAVGIREVCANRIPERVAKEDAEHIVQRGPGGALTRARRSVDVPLAIFAPTDASLVFQDTEKRSDGRMTRRIWQRGRNSGHVCLTLGVQKLHDLPLAPTQIVFFRSCHPAVSQQFTSHHPGENPTAKILAHKFGPSSINR
jgi:hypothetical protein